MDSQNTFDKYYPLLKQHWLPISLGFFGLIFLGYGMIALIGVSKSSSDVIFESSEDSNLSSSSASPKSPVRDIVVDVEGAVLNPGVHHVASDSRIFDALIAAGGLSSDADRDWVTKNLNLAVKVTDGTKIYIPKLGEETEGIKGITHSAGSGQASIKGGNAEDQVNINTASEHELDSLPGVGPVTAQKIISGRQYSSIDELLSKKIVGSKVFEQIKEKITVY